MVATSEKDGDNGVRIVGWCDHKRDQHDFLRRTVEAAEAWDGQSALALTLHGWIHDAESEAMEAKGQPRYGRTFPSLLAFMERQRDTGFTSQAGRHFNTGNVVFFLRHPRLEEVQRLWYDHMLEAQNPECQVVFHFTAQHFPTSLVETLPMPPPHASFDFEAYYSAPT